MMDIFLCAACNKGLLKFQTLKNSFLINNIACNCCGVVGNWRPIGKEKMLTHVELESSVKYLRDCNVKRQNLIDDLKIENEVLNINIGILNNEIIKLGAMKKDEECELCKPLRKAVRRFLA